MNTYRTTFTYWTEEGTRRSHRQIQAANLKEAIEESKRELRQDYTNFTLTSTVLICEDC